jgi:hypothetical protein
MTSSLPARHVAIGLTLSFAMSGCGDINGLLGERKKEKDSAPLPKALEATAIELRDSEYGEECDERFNALRVEVTRELDRRLPEIEALLAATPPSRDYKAVPVGPLTIMERLSQAAGEDEWQAFSEGWPDVEALWKARSATMDRGWLELNGLVRSLLVDDRNRVLWGANYYLTRRDIPLLSKLKADVDACVADEACVSPALGPEAAALADRNEYYSYFVDKLAGPQGGREVLERFKRFVDVDVLDWAFVPNDGVTVDGKTLKVPMNAGPFGGFEDVIEGYITSVWSSAALGVGVVWTDAPDAYSIVVDDDVGGRAYVTRRDREMHIANGVRSKSLAHEFGHVMGLADEYYTSWNPKTCAYTYEYNDANLMSTSSTGLVVKSHVDALKAQYGVK